MEEGNINEGWHIGITSYQIIYFNHEDELENKIREILENWDKYERVVENAYKRSQGYTVENFYPFMKTKDQSLVTWRNNV